MCVPPPPRPTPSEQGQGHTWRNQANPPTPQSLRPDHRKFTSQWRFFPWSENRELGIFDAGPRRTREKTLTNNTGPLKFPYRRVFPPPHPSPLPFGTYFHMPINQMLNWRDMLTNRIRYLRVNLTLAPPPSLQSRGELQPNLLFNM